MLDSITNTSISILKVSSMLIIIIQLIHIQGKTPIHPSSINANATLTYYLSNGQNIKN